MNLNDNFYKITTLILLVVLIVIGGFWLVGKYNAYKTNKDSEIFIQGYNQGVTDAIVKLYQDTENCQQANIFVGNFSRNLVDTACLR